MTTIKTSDFCCLICCNNGIVLLLLDFLMNSQMIQFRSFLRQTICEELLYHGIPSTWMLQLYTLIIIYIFPCRYYTALQALQTRHKANDNNNNQRLLLPHLLPKWNCSLGKRMLKRIRHTMCKVGLAGAWLSLFGLGWLWL